MRYCTVHTCLSLLTVLVLPVRGVAATPLDDDELQFFEKRVRPVLVKHCYACHSAKAERSQSLKASLRVDHRDALLRGGESGPAIVPGDPDASLLITALRYDGPEMPPSGPLAKTVVQDFRRWIAAGAPWPKEDTPSAGQTGLDLSVPSAWRSKHWAWRPLASRNAPVDPADGWSTNWIDRFVWARLRKADLTPAPRADRRTLYRRLSFDLLGLPATFEDVEAFAADPRPGAFHRAVDRMLASPAYGERWGRHWLDVARYADNGGFNSQTKELYTNFPYAFTYRDYVVRAWNEDLPFNRFVIEQLAADKLDLGEDNRALAALGFLTLGNKAFGTNRHDRIDDCIDTLTRGVMALTVACARCHDHKYDPVPTADYYSLYGVFRNSTIDVASRLHTLEKSEILPPIYASALERQQRTAEVDAASHALSAARKEYSQEAKTHLRERLADYLLAAAKVATDAERNGLSKKLIRGWREFLGKSTDAPVFVLWHNCAALGRDATADQIAGKIGEAHENAHPEVITFLHGRTPKSLRRVAELYAEMADAALFDGSASGLSADGLSDVTAAFKEDGSPFRMTDDALLNFPIHSGQSRLPQLRAELRRQRSMITRAVALSDEKAIRAAHVFIRGNPGKRGPVTPRRFLALLTDDRKEFGGGSGRLDLARAVVSPSNPLTPRVIVNRIWHHHFGRGLVVNTSDFGTRSDPPSHPDLLDALATEFVRHGWSIKWLHRTIVMSSTYAQTSRAAKGGADFTTASSLDPENRLLWSMNRRRLSFEALRDKLLRVSGQLDTRMGGRPKDVWKSRRRTVYGYVNRYRIADGYLTFDFPSPERTAGHRNETLVPQQSLFLMNAPFVDRCAQRVAGRLPQQNDRERIAALFRSVLAREPSAADLAASEDFVKSVRRASPAAAEGVWRELAHGLMQSNEFFFVD